MKFGWVCILRANESLLFDASNNEAAVPGGSTPLIYRSTHATGGTEYWRPHYELDMAGTLDHFKSPYLYDHKEGREARDLKS